MSREEFGEVINRIFGDDPNGTESLQRELSGYVAVHEGMGHSPYAILEIGM